MPLPRCARSNVSSCRASASSAVPRCPRASGTGWCARCAGHAGAPVPPPWCARCGQPGLVDVACRFCTGWPGSLGRVRSAVWLEGPAREVVHHLKYGGWPGVAAAMALAMRGLEPVTRSVVLVPVPLSAKRLRKRGYNQAAVLATALGAASTGSWSMWTCCNARATRRHRPHSRPRPARPTSTGAFMAPARVEGTFVLVDDVCTTGATLASAAMALQGGGSGAGGCGDIRAGRRCPWNSQCDGHVAVRAD